MLKIITNCILFMLFLSFSVTDARVSSLNRKEEYSHKDGRVYVAKANLIQSSEGKEKNDAIIIEEKDKKTGEILRKSEIFRMKLRSELELDVQLISIKKINNHPQLEDALVISTQYGEIFVRLSDLTRLTDLDCKKTDGNKKKASSIQ